MNSGPALGAAVPTREAAVTTQIEELNRAVARLEQAASEMCQRLSPVQRPAPPCAQETKNVHEVMCPVADQLRAIANQIERIGYALNDNRERLEI